MKYTFQVAFHGEIESTPEEDAMQGIDHIVDVVKDSFKADLLDGVVLQGKFVNVDRSPSMPNTTGK
jgi:hypothetical protein